MNKPTDIHAFSVKCVPILINWPIQLGIVKLS